VSRALNHIRVRDCMHQGILSCSSDTPLGEVAGMMAEHRVHAVAVTNGTSGRPTGIVSDLDVAAAAATGREPSAGEVATTEPLAVSADDRLHRAAQLMADHRVGHLIVLDAASGHPFGVLSTLDLAAVYAGRAP
jgi:CBS domain-containing protein